MPAIYHEGSWLGNATDPEVLVKDTVGWTGKNRAYSQTNNAVIAHIENGITYDVSWTGSATVTLKKNSASGATITSGSTSPLSFTADADYELYFGSSATVTNIMVKDSRITDPTYEPYHESVEEVVEQVYADNGVLGAKNLLRLNAGQGEGTFNGFTVTYNYNSDGTIKNVVFNGTSTQSAGGIFYQLAQRANSNPIKLLPNTAYIFSIGNTDENVCLQVGYTKNNSYFMVKESPFGADSLMFVAPSDCEGAGWTIQLIKKSGSLVLNNWTVYPMLRLASDPDDTYQPYSMTNRELTEKTNALPREVFVTTDARTTTTNDANTLPCGFTRMNDLNSNLPTDGTGGSVWYDILTVRQSNDSSEYSWGYGFQIAVQTTSNSNFGDMYVRAVNGGATPTWSEWKKLN